ncbi:MAG TPA: Ig-like domain repeat protein [Candidatus Angelobacter sp.]
MPPTRSEGQTIRKPVITGPIDSGATVVLPGTRHALAQPRFDVGAVDAGLKMTRVMLILSPTKEAAGQIQTLLDHQQDRTSADYHHWLTPEEFGQQFGPAPQDIQAVKGWLAQQGLQVTAVAKSGLWMELSGTSGQIERAFQTQMRQYQVNGELHIANATDLSIPAALAPVVQGVASLHNFFKKPLVGQRVQAKANSNGSYTVVTPNATLTGNLHALTPGDYARIYDLSPLYNASLNGTGVQIGLVARNDISISDFDDFRSLTNLLPGNVSNVLTLPPDPGFDDTSGDTVEATLDAEWSGGVAPGASIKVVVSASTATTDGVDLSSAFAVDNNLTDILSVSFGQCEASIEPAENTFFNSLWQQAAAQGMSVFVSSGDNGAAGCDPAEGNTAAQGGLAVSGLASTPFNTAVGGTEFNDASAVTFWSPTNGTGGVSVLGYIPETVWNESCNPNTVGSPCAGQGFFLDAGSGGKSTIYPKPAWQAGFPSAPADTSRDIPDVSLSAAGHDGYVICFDSACEQNFVNIVGGTSASSPSFAGIMAIVVQALGRQGLPNYTLYRLAKGASAVCNSSARTVPSTPAPASCIFNDVTAGNNSVPGQPGFNATSGYDLATGLGSVNAANLVNAWRALTSQASATTLTSNGGTAITAAHGQPVPLIINVTGPSAPAPTGAVALVSSLTGIVDSVALNAPANGATGTFTGSLNNLPGGTYSLTATYPGDSLTAPSVSSPISVNITPEASSMSFTVFGITDQGFPVQATSFPYGSFMDLHTSITGASNNGVATGIVDFKDSALLINSAPVNLKGQADLFMIPGSIPPLPLTPGVHTLTASYEGDASFTASAATALNVTITKGNLAVVLVPSANVFVATQQGILDAAIVVPNGNIFTTGTVQFLEAGVALGVPVAISPGSNQAVLATTFQNEGSHSITASYSGDATYNAAVSPVTTVVVASPFNFAAAVNGGTSATVAAGQTATYNLVAAGTSVNGPATFNGTVTLACSGAPAGTTCSISPASVTLTPATPTLPFTVTVTTTTSAALHKFPFRGVPIFFGAMFAIAISLKGKRKRGWQMAVVAILALGISSCGGGSGTNTPAPNPTPTATQSTIVVTGTSGTHSNTLNLNLTITH